MSIGKNVFIAAIIAIGAAACPAAAEERPACPAGVQGDWTYEVKVDTIRLERRTAPVAWTLEDGTTETTEGYAVSYYWSDPYEGQSERVMDNGQNLQLGLYLLHPPQREMQYGILAFSRNESDRRHDTEEALAIDGEPVLARDEGGWNPQASTSLYLGGAKKAEASAMKSAFEDGGHTFTVDVWFNRDSEYGTSVPYGTATVTVPSVAAAIEALRPVMAAERARQKETGVWCLPTPF